MHLAIPPSRPIENARMRLKKLARKYSLTANKTTSGIIWTFMGDYHSAMVAPRAQNRREALRYMCSVKGIEVPKDIEEMSEI